MADIISIDPLITGFSGDPAHTPVYAVPSVSMKVAEALINATWNEAQGNKALFTSKMTAALTTWLDSASTPHVTAGSVSVPTITEPSITIPASQSAGDVIDEFNTQRSAIVAELVQKLVDFRSSYFAYESNAYTAGETWLRDAIANPSGLPATVIAQIIGDDQSRILADRQRAQDNVMSQFAARGFPLPPGASVSAIMQIEQKAQDLLAESSRKLSMLSVDMQKWNVETILGLRGMAMDSAIKYITALASGQDIASKVIGVGYDAESKFISSISALLNARSNAAETISKVAQYNNSTALEAAAKNQMADLQMVENKLKGLLTEAQQLAQMCTALYNNLHTGATVNTTGGSTVSTNIV